MSVLSERLRELRGTQSQSEMAAALGMKYQQWSRYEKGEVAPGADILANICRVHAVSADWLLGLTDGREPTNAEPPTPMIDLNELRATAMQLAEESATLSGTIKKLKKML